MTRRLVAFATVAALLLAACGAPAAQPAAPAPAKAPPAEKGPAAQPAAPAPAASSGTMVIAQGLLPKALDPAFDTSLFAGTTYHALFETLVLADDKGEIVPSLATSWKTLDPTTWEFKLRQDAKFHNGEPFDAAAAKFTIERILNPEVKSAWATRLNLISSLEATAPDTLVVKTKQPFVALPANLTVAYMLPPKYTAERGVVEFGKAPVGTGPFKLVEWVVDSHLTVERNAEYWKGAPKINRITFRNVPEESGRLAALEAGEAHIAFPVSPDQASRLEGRSELKLEEIALGQAMTVALRSVGTGPLEKKEVRQALNYAIDKERLHKALLQGHGRLLDGQLAGPDTFGYNPNLKPYPYDLNKAKELLAQAGYADGFEVKFDGSVGRYAMDQQVGEAIATELGQIGVRTRYNVLESGQYISGFLDGSIGPMYLFGWNLAPAMSVDQPYPYHTSSAPQKLFANPEFDRLMAEQAAEFDVEKRRQILQQLGQIYREEAAAIFLWQSPMIYGLSSKVGSFGAHPDARLDLATMTLGS
jgi:peptide/nickel transport system substrate-binding protein